MRMRPSENEALGGPCAHRLQQGISLVACSNQLNWLGL